MATEPSPLITRVVDVLDRSRVPYALIGAAALAIHGVSRSTVDLDLLVTDRRVLDPTLWNALSDDVVRDVRVGDAADPLAGVIRFSADGQRDVDIVIGRGAWDADIVARAEAAPHHGRHMPTARVEDLILLKLYAGGNQDRWDIEQLLARPDRVAVVEAVERSLPRLPPEAHRLWRTLSAGPQP